MVSAVRQGRAPLDWLNFFLAAFGIGAALSTTVAGMVVVNAGYTAVFLTLAGIATAGLALFWIAMPETQNVAVHPEASGTFAVVPAE
jgi:predicted MFS family arabinose efflux permease